ncbi:MULTISPECIES: GH25 family lysozyme [Leptolyngbya]|jgi:lysozyme|uniref:GH25 family lysozyme n=2 Tax=Leptolyngbya boryana TaxID=1184 RepID=A0AA96WXK0_LEPBY|nr:MULTISPECIES: GH25 family lysozyme [Leptolyngbya]BAY57968.1 putative hydrolase [Leptolyngbya boryana NIES-2135]MBD2367412.1 peptidoglycan-binding protein [Leptolyngbya sp. FACHB-161]MBD2373936.1 peptidoglycan-binding protein [Leptolyngbya sp. FACHB-238]MBD2398264.1 peptidoglycan-binding protein [Leptolyngbya sp. FACHB-239]MBD2404239.1 peptidoglycan-binding protein [Leptolyngbya sp. FACHB-402]
MALLGIDISAYQEDVNWATVASQSVFYGFAKATEGVTSRDEKFARNWAGMRSVGIVRGAYHFFRPGRDPAQQADNFLKTVQTIEDFDLPPVLDLEINDGQSASVVIDRALKWLEIIEAKTGRKPILYTYPSFWEDKLGNTARFSEYPLWIANFGTPGRPYIPSAWKLWVFHQYSESGTLRGIVGNVDLNQFNGDLDGLQKLLKGRIPLRQGCEGNVVQEMQSLLKAQGFDLGTPDGDFGPKTKAQVVAFQKAKSLLTDGIVGAATWSALQKTSPSVPPAPLPIDLINVCKSYRGAAHQDSSLRWLQSQIPKSTLDEFARRWRQP